MAKAPSNEGLYQALYQEVATNIGCRLSIERAPKQRTLYSLEHGTADLYPSTGFDEHRSKYLFYIPNGLYRLEPYLGLTPSNVPELKKISDITQYGLSWIFEAGDTTQQVAEALQVPNEPIVDLTTDRAVKMLSRGRQVFYRMIQQDYFKYLKANNLRDLRHLNIATHLSCCEPKSHILYTGFSRTSSYYAEEPNPEFNPHQEITAENYPYRIANHSIAYKVAAEIQNLKDSGRVNTLYQNFIIKQGHTP
ncbi:hypothetical protein ACFOEK_09530 [Litoribrevibacter euphylliae]|uniref:Uncharacterized protein n=1 Tax=Litoribrevibacter euphylliae TaxID=1834034 RepID=A0ABV7HBI0_9GAMM